MNGIDRPVDHKHCSDDELLDNLYGLGGAAEHVNACPECSARAQQLSRTRAEATAPPAVSYDLLMAQRRSIHGRLGSPMRSWRPLRWAVSVIAMLIVVLGITVLRPTEPSHSRDDQFFAEISALDHSTPQAVQPIEALVQDGVQE